MITKQDSAISLFNLCSIMGVDMPVIDITTFICSECGRPIPDRFLSDARLHSTGNGIRITCQECDKAECAEKGDNA